MQSFEQLCSLLGLCSIKTRLVCRSSARSLSTALQVLANSSVAASKSCVDSEFPNQVLAVGGKRKGLAAYLAQHGTSPPAQNTTLSASVVPFSISTATSTSSSTTYTAAARNLAAYICHQLVNPNDYLPCSHTLTHVAMEGKLGQRISPQHREAEFGLMRIFSQ